MIRRLSCCPLLALSLLAFRVSPALAQNTAYCNITRIDARQLSNGVQITVQADGVLRYQNDNSGSGARVGLRFTNAKSLVGKSFIDVSKYPVSYIQLSIPQDAREGVGVRMQVAMYEWASSSIERSSDQQSVIITINSQRTIQKRASNGAGDAARVDETTTIQYEDGRLAVDAVKAKLAVLIANIARKTDTNIAVDDSVREREISLSLHGVTVDEALRGLASAAGLALSDVDGVYMVSDGVPNDLATYHLASTESFRMKYTKAQAASGLLPTFLYSFLHVNEAQNAIVVTAPAQMLDKIRADFQKIDIAPPQIMIEALAVEISNTEDKDASLGLAYKDQNVAFSSDSATGDLTYSTIGALPADFQARLRGLVAKGKAHVRANPRMAAVNGQNADLFIGQTKFIKVEYLSGGYKQERIQGVDVGVKLAIRSWTGGNGEITVTLEPEVSNISELERETGLPVLSTRRAETTVRVKDGETIVIGGLTQRQEYRTRSKVPFLGDLPLIGLAFRSTKTSTVDSELVIFVTPHILTDHGRLKDESRETAIRERFSDPAAPAADPRP